MAIPRVAGGGSSQPYARTTSWAFFAALAVTLIAALLGGTAGARRIVVPTPL